MKAGGILPYPGLRAFARDEAHLFFGREGCVDEMIGRLAATRFLAVLGASGSGKSSLVRTGLLSSLELGFFARAGACWSVAELHPGGQPLRNLAAALIETEENPQLEVGMLSELLARGPRSVIEWCSNGGLAAGHNLLILVDQFEELFRYGDYAAREEAEAFVGLLIESARSTEAPIHVVLTMRSEYLGACALIPGLAEEINAGFYLTPRMSREECRAAIEGPAALGGFTIESALVNQILNDMASFAPWEEERGVAQGQLLSRRADQLPLMQHLLNRLWLRAKARAGEGPVELRLEDYQAAGGLAGSLDDHGDEIIEALDPGDRDQVETIFRALVSGPDPTNAIRRPCRFDELAAEVEGGREVARRIVEAFRAPDCNFLRPEAHVPLADETLVDISHESLIRQWTTLAGWLRDEARAGDNWRRLLIGAERRAAGEGELLTGLDLASLAAWWDAERPTPAWAKRHGGRYEEAERYLAESREAAATARRKEEARATRERRRLMTSVAAFAVMVILSASGGYSFYQWSEAQRQAEVAQDAMERANRGERDARHASRDEQRARKNAENEAERARAARAALAVSLDRANRLAAEARRQSIEADRQRRIALAAQNALSAALDEADRLRRLAQQVADESTSTLTAVVNEMSEDQRRQMAATVPGLHQFISAGTADIPPETLAAALPRPTVQQGPVYRELQPVILEAPTMVREPEPISDGPLAQRRASFEAATRLLRDSSPGDEEHEARAASLLDTGYNLAWQLFDTNLIDEGERVLATMRETAASFSDGTVPPRLILPLARYERLRGRRFDELGRGGESDAADARAAELARRQDAPAEDRAELDRLLSIVLSEAGGTPEERRRNRIEACNLARRALRSSPRDVRHIVNVSRCEWDLGRYTLADGDEAAFEAHVDEAGRLLEGAIAADPDSVELLLARAELELNLGEVAQERQRLDEFTSRQLAAADLFARALVGRTYLELNVGQVRRLYARFADLDLATLDRYESEAARRSEYFRLYARVEDAVAANYAAFPSSPSYGFVRGDAAARRAGHLLAAGSRDEALAGAETAIETFARAGILRNQGQFSEDSTVACAPYALRVQIHVEAGRADDAAQAYQALWRDCGPSLERFPWDFYLRQHFVDAATRLGRSLHEQGRYREAVPILRLASDWGTPESSRILADIYRNGRSVAADPERASSLDALAGRQSIKRFTVPTDFGGTPYPFEVYVLEYARGEYCPVRAEALGAPSDCIGFEGIDDQVEWVRQARGGTVPQDVIDAFRSLNRIARQNDVSFPELTLYALSAAEQEQGGADEPPEPGAAEPEQQASAPEESTRKEEPSAAPVSTDELDVLATHFFAIDLRHEPPFFMQSTSIEYRPDSSCFRWALRVAPRDQTIPLREELLFPAPPRVMNSGPMVATTLVDGGRRAISRFSDSASDGFLEHGWCIADGDPIGPHRIHVFHGERLLHEFAFDVVPAP